MENNSNNKFANKFENFTFNMSSDVYNNKISPPKNKFLNKDVKPKGRLDLNNYNNSKFIFNPSSSDIYNEKLSSTIYKFPDINNKISQPIDNFFNEKISSSNNRSPSPNKFSLDRSPSPNKNSKDNKVINDNSLINHNRSYLKVKVPKNQNNSNMTFEEKMLSNVKLYPDSNIFSDKLTNNKLLTTKQINDRILNNKTIIGAFGNTHIYTKEEKENILYQQTVNSNALKLQKQQEEQQKQLRNSMLPVSNNKLEVKSWNDYKINMFNTSPSSRITSNDFNNFRLDKQRQEDIRNNKINSELRFGKKFTDIRLSRDKLIEINNESINYQNKTSKAWNEYKNNNLNGENKFLNVFIKYKCKCCYDEFDFSQLITCSLTNYENEHTFCKECLSGYINSNISENQAKTICMMSANGCKGCFKMDQIEQCISAEDFLKLQDIEMTNTVKSMSGILADYHICPFCEKFGIEIPNKHITATSCGVCNKTWCLKCKQPEHIGACGLIQNPLTVKEELVSKIVTETITDAAMHDCPKCKMKYIKNEACNFIRCSTCNTGSCFICHEVLLDHSHFGASIGNCPLYCKDILGRNTDYGQQTNLTPFYKNRVKQSCLELLNINSDPRVQKMIRNELTKQGIMNDIEPRPPVSLEPPPPVSSSFMSSIYRSFKNMKF
jgi:hypothetical protein